MTETLHRFTSGKYAGKTIEEVFLRDAPHVYRMKAAQETGRIVDAINELRKRLRGKKTVVRCMEGRCTKRAEFMTFPVGNYGEFHLSPYWWCRIHEPWEKRGISLKVPIHFDAVTNFRGKQAQGRAHRAILEAYGITKGMRITERFALEFLSEE